MSWKHKVLAHEHNERFYLQIHEVYQDKDNIPDGYTESAMA